MKKATFYIVEQLFLQAEPDSHELLACQLAGEKWRMGKRVLIACEDQIQAKKLDEMLWQKEPNQFIPHNLAGNGPKYGAPIELCWPTKCGSSMSDILINLQLTFTDFALAFHEVIDFVPVNERMKKLARERYKIYRSIGFNLIIAAQKTK